MIDSEWVIKKLNPGRNTGVVLIKVFLTIKPYPMKDQKYVGYSAFPELILWLLISLLTYFKKALVNYLKTTGPIPRIP